jgi:hypothetical protein
MAITMIWCYMQLQSVVSYKTKMEKVNDRRRTPTAGKVHTGFQSGELIKGYD